MTRQLTPAERLASAEKDMLLEEISQRSTWDRFLVEQAVFAFGLAHETFNCNMIRAVLPELGRGFLGAVINSLRGAGIIAHTGQYVPSTSAATHGHPIAVWTITAKGRLIAARRHAARTRKAA